MYYAPNLTATPGAQAPVILSSVKRGKQTVKLTTQDMLDRIINLRFTHKPASPSATPKTFTIRSDYEPMYYPGGFRYVTTQQKPAISVSYRQVANDVVTELTIDVTNLFIKNQADLEANKEPIQQVEIQMGYRSQMPDWVHDDSYNTKPLSEFMALYTMPPKVGEEGYVSPTKIIAQVLSVQKITNPPDMVTRFTCAVGNMSKALRWMYSADAVAEEVKNQTLNQWYGKVPKNSLPYVFLNLITRRFVNPRIKYDLHEKTTVEQATDVFNQINNKLTQVVTIYDEKLQPVEQLQLENGVMSVEQASKYGVHVYISNKLWDTPLEEAPNWTVVQKEKAKFEPIKGTLFTEQYAYLSAQLNAICTEHNYIRFYPLGDGNYYAYHVSESSDDFLASDHVLRAQQKKITMLPAVYDITWGGTRQIRMPFFGGINPLDTVAFQARYALNDFVGYYYSPPPENTFFLIMLAEAEFSTVDDKNMLTLMCIDMVGKYAPSTNPDGSLQPVALSQYNPSPERNKTWFETTWTVSSSPSNDPNVVDNSWGTILVRLISSANVADWNNVSPTIAQAVSAIQGWNSSLFTTGRLKNPSPESLTLGHDLPTLLNGDSVTVRLPFLQTYE